MVLKPSLENLETSPRQASLMLVQMPRPAERIQRIQNNRTLDDTLRIVGDVKESLPEVSGTVLFDGTKKSLILRLALAPLACV